MSLRILIADDHGVLRAGLSALLSAAPDIQVVGEAADGEEALRLADALRPDIVLMDLSMPGCNGVEATRRLGGTHPDIRVLILTVHEDKALLREVIEAGAAGYILKRASEAELFSAIRAVSQGDLYIHPAMTRALLTEASRSVGAKERHAEPLTPREIEVLRLIAKGYVNHQVASALNVSVRTVESHRANLMGKLGLHSRVELTRYAAECGLLGEREPD